MKRREPRWTFGPRVAVTSTPDPVIARWSPLLDASEGAWNARWSAVRSGARVPGVVQHGARTFDRWHDALEHAIREHGEAHPATLAAARRLLGARRLLRLWPGLRRDLAEQEHRRLAELFPDFCDRPQPVAPLWIVAEDTSAEGDEPEDWNPRAHARRGPPCALAS